jgi:hypothetical protein
MSSSICETWLGWKLWIGLDHGELGDRKSPGQAEADVGSFGWSV